MPIEAELKAHVHDVAAVRSALSVRAPAKPATYQDIYFDRPDGRFMATGQELRLRTVRMLGDVRHVLTYKAPAVDEASGSKPEHETAVTDPDATRKIILGLGFDVAIAFTKQCENHSFSDDGYAMLATLVTVPEIDGTFLEVETLVDTTADVDHALGAVRRVLTDLGVGAGDLTTELYTDAVAKADGARPAT